MRSLALPVLTLALASCGTSREPTTDQDVTQDPEVDAGLPDHDGGPPADGASAMLQVGAGFYSPSCDFADMQYEALVQYGDGTFPGEGVECSWTFDDGGTSSTCAGVHRFEEGGVHGVVLVVRDRATGETATWEGQGFVYPALTAELAITPPECGLTFSFASEVSTTAFQRVSIAPPENVVGDPFVFGGSGSFTVTAPGTYQVTLYVEDERTSGPICELEVTRPVTLVECHGPDCGHEH